MGLHRRNARGNRNSGGNNQNILTSRCAEYICKGDKNKLIAWYEDMASRASCSAEAENFNQHAEHYRRL